MFRTKTFAFSLLLLALLTMSAQAWAQNNAQNPTRKVGKYAVQLRIPQEGIYAEEEVDIEFRVTDTSQEDPVQGALPVLRARIAASVHMPSMPAMPKQNPKWHAEGIPGDYGVVCFFPHGGEYQLDLTITPPGDKPFTASFKLMAQDAVDPGKRKPKPKPYTLEVKANPPKPRAGEPVDLTFVIRNRETKQPVSDFEIVHEKTFHLIMVSKDLSRFAHEHPDFQPGGKFTIRFTFPTGGEYRLFADVAPRGAGSQYLMQPLVVAGSAPAIRLAAAPAMQPVGGVQVALQNTSGLTPRKSLALLFSLKDTATGAPPADLEPYLGAMAHLILIHQDGATFVHSHPDEPDPQKDKPGQMSFHARFPKPGLYKGWFQFQRKGQVETTEFVVEAKEQAR